MSGIVWLVGAGPGDPQLLTLRALQCIQEADVIIYDRLVNPFILQWADSNAERIYVGKAARAHIMSQSEINELLIAKARAGKKVCRLKGGDPFLFGRGGEEAEALAKANVPFEIVPGVSSALAVPAYAGIPITDRRYASSVAMVTGHEAESDVQSPHPVRWEQLATAVDTLVVLMGVKRLSEIVETLLKAGVLPSTPAALIERGTTPQQRTIVSTLAELASVAQRAGVEPPAVLVVGNVVELRNTLAWFERKPLHGLRILVTRDEQRGHDLVRLLASQGADAMLLPVIRITAPSDSSLLQAAIHRFIEGAYDWVIFTSANGVRAFFAMLHELGEDARAFASTKICAIGSVTAEVLKGNGIIADLIPYPYTTASIARALSDIGIAGNRILLPRAEDAPRALVDALTDAGAEVDEVPAYRVVTNRELSQDEIQIALHAHIDIVCFTSPSTVNAFFEVIGSERAQRVLQSCRIACIGPVTANAIRKRGLIPHIIADEHTSEGLVQAIVQDASTH